jgi:hypothetical protein
MRALVLNGALSAGGGVARVEATLRDVLAERGCAMDVAVLRAEPIAYCRGCFECWTTTPGVCRTGDAGPALARRLIGSDLVVFLTPITFGGYSSELKKALDRSIGLVMPFFQRIDGETHHRRRYARFPALLGLGVLPAPDPDDEALFRTLLRRNALNMHAPVYAAGVVYESEPASSVRDCVDGLLAAVLVAA